MIHLFGQICISDESGNTNLITSGLKASNPDPKKNEDKPIKSQRNKNNPKRSQTNQNKPKLTKLNQNEAKINNYNQRELV